MAKTRQHLTVPELEDLAGHHEPKQKYRRYISAEQHWFMGDLDSIRLRIRGETIYLDVAKARRLGEWLVAATFAKRPEED